MKVPLLDLDRQYKSIQTEVKETLLNIFDSKQFINGPQVSELENQIATYTGSQYAIGVSSGSDALIVAMMALDIGQDDEVITTPFSFFATAGCIARLGAKPVFCDIEPNTFNIDISQIESKITSKTKAIMPVHLFGQCANMEEIQKIAKKHNLAIIEDAAQALGATYNFSDGNTKKAGNLGTIGCFSFFPSKNLGACGDAGIVTTNDKELAEKIKCLRMHGETQRYHHKYVGGNFRLDTIQAAVLSIKLTYLDDQHKGRQSNASFYNKNLLESIQKPYINSQSPSIYNQYTLKIPNRDSLKEYLSNQQIGNNIYYPIPLHLQECFQYLGYTQGDFPEAETAAKQVLSIPIFTELTQEELEYTCHHINQFVKDEY
ncbi:transcriptional regulator [bacterium]|nr:transcriptional regulator [bacterium]